MDRLLEVAQSQPDLAVERPYLYQAQQMVQRDQPVTFLWESQRLTAVNKRVKNVHPTAIGSFSNLKEWWIEP
jgi:ABC-type transport system substrate-binding protein